MIIIKIDDILFDIKSIKKQAIKKSIEFFIGGYIEQSEIDEFRQKHHLYDLDLLRKFLESKKIYLRDIALSKKLNEYYLGKEFNGLISTCELLVDEELLSKISSKVTFVSFLPKDAAKFLLNKFDLKLKVLYYESALKAMSKLKSKIIKFVGTNTLDYEAAVKNKVNFIGYQTDLADEKIEKIEDLF